MLSDFEDDIGEDLPSISLSQSTGEKSVTEMPPAAEVASERARRAAAEQALRELREPPPSAAPAPAPAPAHAHANKVADDGEAELVKAWLELRVDPEGGGGGGAGGGARARLLRELRARLGAAPGGGAGAGGGAGGALLDAWLRACQRGPDVAAAVTEQMLSGIILGLESAGSAKGTVAAAAWLLAVACTGGGAGGGGGGRARRALHELLDAHATCDQIDELASVAAPALLAAGGAALLLAAHDAARSGGARGADRLAAALLGAALTAALPPRGQEMECWEARVGGAAGVASLVRGAWRGLPARAQLLVLRGAARALALSAEPDAGLLRALGQPLPRSQDPLGRQQVLSNVSKLQLLFRERAGEGGAGDAGDPPEPAGAGLQDELDKDDATAISAEGGAPAGAGAGLRDELMVDSAESGTEGGAPEPEPEPEPEPKRLRRSPRARAAAD